MADRRVKVVFSAEVQNFKASMEAAAQATTKAKKASEDAGKAADKSAEEIQKQALAHHEAAKAAGLQYDNTGQLVTMNGKAVSSQQAATHGLQTFSAEAYLAGRAAVAAGEDSEAAAKAAAEAEAKAAAAVEKRREALERVGAIAMTAGAVTLAGVGLAVKSYADFDKAMSSVDAATHETAGNMQLLRQAAIDTGADTAFSAVEAAQGIEEMAKAGVTTKEILGGGLKGALDLAAAGSLSVGEAAEIAASAMTQFGLSGEKVPHIADILAAGAGKAQGSVHDMGEALNQVGLVAAQTGLSIEETTGGLAAFASAGLTGSDAGTSFKTMLAAVTPNSKEAAKAMEELGISAFDANGEFIGLSEYAGVLKNAMSGLTDENRIATMETIFGSDAVRAASVMYEQGAEGVQKWEDAVNDAGYASVTAAKMQDNLAGDLEKLGGAFDTVLIQSGSGANEVLRGMVQGLEGLVDVIGQVPAPVLGAATGIAALTGGAALVGGALITVIPKIRDTRDALDEIAPAGGRARGALAAVGNAAGIATVAFAGFEAVKGLHNSMQAPTASIEKFTQALVGIDKEKSAIDGLFKDIGAKEFEGDINGAGDALNKLINQDFNSAIESFGASIGVDNGMAKLADGITKVDSAIASAVQSGDMDLASKGFKSIADSAAEKGVKLDEVGKKFPAYLDSLRKLASDSKVALTEQELLDWAMGKIPPKMEAAAKATDGAKVAIEGAGAAAEDAGPSAEELAKGLEDVGLRADGSVENLDKFTQALVNAGLLTLSSRDATANFEEGLDALDGKIKEIMATEQAHGGVLNETKTDLDLMSEAGRAANGVLADMTQKGIASAQAMAANGASMPAVQGELKRTYDAMVTTAKGFGLGKDEAEALTRSILHIPPGVDVNTWMDDEAKRMAEATKGAIDAIPSRKDVLISVTEQYTKFISEIKNPTQADLNGDTFRPKQTGGRIPGFAEGGQLPMTGPGTDRRDGFLGISSAGVPLARVDAGEWIINRGSSGRYNRELAAINAGTFPKLPGYANGGRAREYEAPRYAYQQSAPAQVGGMHVERLEISQQSDPVATFHEFNRRANMLRT